MNSQTEHTEKQVKLSQARTSLRAAKANFDEKVLNLTITPTDVELLIDAQNELQQAEEMRVKFECEGCPKPPAWTQLYRDLEQENEILRTKIAEMESETEPLQKRVKDAEEALEASLNKQKAQERDLETALGNYASLEEERNALQDDNDAKLTMLEEVTGHHRRLLGELGVGTSEEAILKVSELRDARDNKLRLREEQETVLKDDNA